MNTFPVAVRSLVATLAGLGTCLQAQVVPPPAAARGPTGQPGDNVVELSPFTVTAEAEQGYIATQTLNGTRLKTSVRDVGAAMTIFTDQIMDDLAANSVLDLVSFAPNTDAYVGNLSDTTGAGNEFLTNQSPQYVTRGGTTGLISQDFFSTPSVPPDRYNAESFTFTRGPNAILFGLGNAAGAFTSATKRARFKNRYSVELRGDDEGGLRGTIDLNHVLFSNRLALRYAGLREDAKGFREPSDDKQRRHFLTATYAPFKKTSLRASVETGEVHTTAVRPWPVSDGVTPWLEAGSPMVARGQPLRPGIENAYGAAQNLLVMDNTPVGTVVPPMRWLNQRRSANPSFPLYPNLATRRSLLRPDIFPIEANVIGNGSARDLDFDAVSAAWEQQFTRDLFAEASINHVLSDTIVSAAFNGLSDRLYVDVNQQLPDGSPNPNAGMYYVDSMMNVLPNRYKNTTKRLMLSYELDFARTLDWKRSSWLGRHRFAAMGEDSHSEVWGSQNPSQNLTPLPGDPAAISDVARNRVFFRYYLDPARGVTSAGINGVARYPLVFAGTTLPERDPSGVTPGLAAIFGGTAADTRLRTQMIATQSHFWKDRLVGTLGFRRDRQTNYRGQQADFAPFADSRGLYPDPRNFDARTHFPDSRIDESGRTYTRGLVFHVLPWLSLSYNASNSLQPNSTVRDVAGNLLPATEGEGRDYGLKFIFGQGRVVADVVYYKNYSRNRADRAVANGVHGNFQNDINAIWSTIAAIERDPKYEDQPYAFTGSNWQDVNTGYSDGVEGSLTANITPEWRITLNASKRGPGETQDRGSLLKGYLATNMALWRGNPLWMATPLVGGNQTGTIADIVARIENTMASFDALAELPSDSLLSPEWSTNLVTSYAFPKESRFSRFSIGASANIRGKTVIGFAEDSSQVLIADRPFYAREFASTGAWITYRQRLLKNKVEWRLQLNVRNLLDENRVFPSRAVDRRDGTGAGEVVIHRLNAPRTFLLTSAFTF